MLTIIRSSIPGYVVLGSFLAGCSSSPDAIERPTRVEFRKLGVVAGEDGPTDLPTPYPKGKATAVGGAGTAAAGAAQGALASMAAGPFALVVMPVFVGAGALAGGIVGSAVGANTGLSDDEIDRTKVSLEKVLGDVLRDRSASEYLVDVLVARTEHYEGYELTRVRSEPPYGHLAGDKAGLEIAVSGIALEGGQLFDPPLELAIYVEAVAGSPETPDQRILRKLRLTRGPHKFIEWGKDDAALFREALEGIIEEAADELMYSLFARYYELERQRRTAIGSKEDGDASDPPVPLAGFAPLYPAIWLSEFAPRLRESDGGSGEQSPPRYFRVRTDRVQAGQVTLSWEPFPGTFRPEPFAPRSAFVNQPAASIADVRYEVAVWQLRKEFSWLDGWDYYWDPLYTRSDITEPRHTIARTLCEGCKYAWTVRAVFLLDGQTRVTPWSALALPSTSISMFSGWTAGGDDGGWGAAHPGYYSNDVARPWLTTPMPQIFYYPLEIR